MLSVRKGHERGHSYHGWLDSYHSFSFSNYYDPEHSGFSKLLVINDDRIAPGAGFATHSHRDMEIITYVLEGALEHKDSLGTGSVIRPGEVQLMSAGTGISHSEYNASATEPVHLLQIWIEPNQLGVKPRYQQERFPLEELQGHLRLVVSPDGREQSLMMHQDAFMYAGQLTAGDLINYSVNGARKVYVQVADGELNVNDQHLVAGDGLKVLETDEIRLATHQAAHVLLFDLP
ncbi:MAG TPA: pirin family protein [Gammaproteobacteria bacterium]|nr:pirin family protein [Gammaproteobacteria bacterium]